MFSNETFILTTIYDLIIYLFLERACKISVNLLIIKKEYVKKQRTRAETVAAITKNGGHAVHDRHPEPDRL